MEPFTHCLRYHAAEAVDTRALETTGFKGELLGVSVSSEMLVFQCLHRVCCARIGMVVEDGMFTEQRDAGGIAACEYYGSREN